MPKISFCSFAMPEDGALILTVADKRQLGEQGTKLDRKLKGALVRAMEAQAFTGGSGQSLNMPAAAGLEFSRIVLVGLGAADKANDVVFQKAGAAALAAMGGTMETEAVACVDSHKGIDLSAEDAAAHFAFGAKLRAHRFDHYKTKLKPEQKDQLKSFAIATDEAGKAKTLFGKLEKVVDGVYLTRNLVSEPANILTPEVMAKRCVAELEPLGVKVEVLDDKQMKKLGMGALLGVGQGSCHPSRLVVMQWQGNPSAKDQKPLALVGKGVTFDTGGISLKPGEGMERMKYDMAGAGAVIGAIKALAGRKAKANVVGIVGLVENMPDGMAQRPGDVVTTMSGQTVEVINTDAEGRLVLADALWYAQETFKPSAVVNLATLTGAIIIALGREYGGLFSNDDLLCDKLTAAGKAVDEPLWRFPMGDAYDKHIDSPIADMKNIGARGEAGSISAAQFLQRFIQKGTVWAHLDIAGMAWTDKDKPMCRKGATAYGVRLLDKFVAQSFEAR
ncbi:MAG: leucyl aminopeptidase [Bdellovibrionales bacterium]